MEEIQKINPLRSRDECEHQLAVELAVGAVDSIDSLIEKGHVIACEYAAQMIFDSLRKKVASQENLPINIVNYLLHDRCDIIRSTAAEVNWSRLTEDQHEDIIHEAETLFGPLTVKGTKRFYKYNSPAGCAIMYNIIDHQLKLAAEEYNEPLVLRCINIIGVFNINLSVEQFKKMPNVFRLYWERTSAYDRSPHFILAHPDEEVRMAEVQKVMDKKYPASTFRLWRRSIRIKKGDSLKISILKLWALDPSVKIREYIATHTTNVDVLTMLVTDAVDTVSQIAYPRYAKFQKRQEYSQSYQQRKQSIANATGN